MIIGCDNCYRKLSILVGGLHITLASVPYPSKSLTVQDSYSNKDNTSRLGESATAFSSVGNCFITVR